MICHSCNAHARNQLLLRMRAYHPFPVKMDAAESTFHKLTDILLDVDAENLSVLVLLDLSATFDTVDHDILLRRLSKSFGVGAGVLDWFRSYLTGRAQYVRRGKNQASTMKVLYGLPQGSVLGPLLFILYTADLITVIESSGLRPHLYADDTQIQDSCIASMPQTSSS